MKIRPLFLLPIVAIGLCQCSSPNAVSTSEPPILPIYTALTGATEQFRTSLEQTGSSPQALGAAENWLRNQPGVTAVYDMDSADVYITLESGLTTTISVIELDQNGVAITRGGSPKDGQAILQAFGRPASHEIKNHKVLLYVPEYRGFYEAGELDKVLALLKSSSADLDVTVLKGEQASATIVNHFSEYGLVILDTHGLVDRFLTGGVLVVSGVPQTEQNILDDIDYSNQPEVKNYVRQADIALGSLIKVKGKKVDTTNIYFWATSKLLKTSPMLNNTVVFGNMCYSGFTPVHYTNKAGVSFEIPNPIQPAFMSRDPITYYAYNVLTPAGSSKGVDNDFAKTMEDSIVHHLTGILDSTGIAHLGTDGSEHAWNDLYLLQYGHKDFSYRGCVDSFVDDRDGHVYRAVCIGKQTWMADNLDYDLPGSACYDGQAANCSIYGKMYTWDQLMQGAAATDAYPSGVRGICPKGWHLPSIAEWDTLISFLGGPVLAGGPMKAVSSLWSAPNAGATNSSGFSGLPGGFFDNTYVGIGTIGWFGTTSLSPQNAQRAYVLYNYNTQAYRGTTQTSVAVSCRCIEDK